MTRPLSLIAALTVVAITALGAQAPATFEVASVKANKSGQPYGDIRIQPGGRYAFVNMTLKDLMGVAYSRFAFDTREIIGGPNWIAGERFDVVAKAPEGVPLVEPGGAPTPVFRMLRVLLEDRFQLRTHEESLDRPVYALTMVKAGQLGAHLRLTSTDCTEVMRQQASGTFKADPNKVPPCSVGLPAPGVMTTSALTMEMFSHVLGRSVGRPVVDRTGLVGNYDLELEFRPEISTGGRNDQPLTGAPDLDKPSIFTAMQEQLGLKLESTRAPIEVLVVDRAERPTEN